MTKLEITEMLSVKHGVPKTITWLRNEYLAEIVQRFNSEQSRKRFALYQGEKIPANERNLTDVRTRMGILIEFELARLSNIILEENGITDIFWTYVVANRFPDLEVRNNNGGRHIRLEIKTLQCIAEEKSANFDTLLKDINPSTDFVVVFLWDWDKTLSASYKWDAAPFILNAFVFNAYSLAMLRDTYWLNSPPNNLGDGFQGFDLRYAVTCAAGTYSKEQGNYGKLTRIWKNGFPYNPQNLPLIDDTIAEYSAFQNEIICSGFEILAKNHLETITKSVPMKEPCNHGYYFHAENVAYFLSTYTSAKHATGIALQKGFSRFVIMTEKYRCSIYVPTKGSAEKVRSNEKPKNVLKFLLSLSEN